MIPPFLRNMVRISRNAALQRDIEAGLAYQRRMRAARSTAAVKGVSTYWANAGRRAREMFGD